MRSTIDTDALGLCYTVVEVAKRAPIGHIQKRSGACTHHRRCEVTLADGEVIRVSFRSTLEDGQDHVNVYYFIGNLSTAATDTEVVDAVNDLLDQMYGRLNDRISNTFNPVDLKIDVVEFVGGDMEIVRNIGLFPFDPTNFIPDNAGDTLPPGVAVLVKFLTTIGKVYGRKFIGGLCESEQDGGYPGSLLLTALANFISDLLAGATIAAKGTLDPGVMSTREAAFVPFTSGEVGTTLAYQRRRRLGTGS